MVAAFRKLRFKAKAARRLGLPGRAREAVKASAK
jgi:hypothetical protein